VPKNISIALTFDDKMFEEVAHLGKQFAEFLVVIIQLAELSPHVSVAASSVPGRTTTAAHRRPLPHQFQRLPLLAMRITPQLNQLSVTMTTDNNKLTTSVKNPYPYIRI